MACAPGPDRQFGTADDPGIPNQTLFFAGELKLYEVIGSVDVTRSFTTGAGTPVNVAFGAAFRGENYQLIAGEPASFIDGGHLNRDSLAAPPGSQVFTGFRPGDEADEWRSNFAVYGELESTLGPGVLANVAGRFESYSDFGERVTGKLALRYQPTPRWTFRGAVSSGFRAPAQSQSFYASITTNFKPDPVTGAPTPFEVGIFPVEDSVPLALGARPLQEETSINVSGGFAFSPIEDLTFTVDGFFIDMDDRIVLSTEIGGEGTPVEAFLQDTLGLQASAVQFFTNAIDTRTFGLDFTGNYRAFVGESGRFDLTGVFNFLGNDILGVAAPPPELAAIDPGEVLFNEFDEGGLLAIKRERPRWRGAITARYTDGRWSFLGRSSLYGEYTSSLLSASDPQTYGSEGLFDAEVGYQFTNGVRLAVGAKNIFDNFPDRVDEGATSFDEQVNSFGVMQWPTASPFGFNGRFLYARMEMQLTP